MPNKPKTAQGSSRKIEVVAVSWTDLLGYGSMLAEANFDPTHTRAKEAIERMRRFHEVTEDFSNRYFSVSNMNDAAIATRDMSPRAASVTYDFISRSVDFLNAVNKIDQDDGFPGARMIIAAGLRVRPESQDELYETGNAERIIRKIRNKSADAVQVVHEALRFSPTYKLSPELQVNFAFTKAYLADSDGSEAGFAGPNCFIDMAFFEQEHPEYFSFEKFVDWKTEGMGGIFGQLEELDKESAGRAQHQGMLDAFEIAKRISADESITERLKESTL